jgi:hypothetical protein
MESILPDSTKPQPAALPAMDGQPQPSVTRVVAGNLFALFCCLVLGALAVFGIISMILGHILMFAAALVGTLVIFTDLIPDRPAKHKAIGAVILWVVLLAGDYGIVMYKRSHVESPAIASLPKQIEDPPPAREAPVAVAPTAANVTAPLVALTDPPTAPNGIAAGATHKPVKPKTPKPTGNWEFDKNTMVSGCGVISADPTKLNGKFEDNRILSGGSVVQDKNAPQCDPAIQKLVSEHAKEFAEQLQRQQAAAAPPTVIGQDLAPGTLIESSNGGGTANEVNLHVTQVPPNTSVIGQRIVNDGTQPPVVIRSNGSTTGPTNKVVVTVGGPAN